VLSGGIDQFGKLTVVDNRAAVPIAEP